MLEAGRRGAPGARAGFAGLLFATLLGVTRATLAEPPGKPAPVPDDAGAPNFVRSRGAAPQAPPVVPPPVVAPPLVAPPLVAPPLVAPPLVAPPLVAPIVAPPPIVADPQAGQAKPKTATLSLSVTVGGGVSLGSYQAGLLYDLSEGVKAVDAAARAAGKPSPVSVDLGTGASAGSLNALLMLLTTCLPREDDPTKSLFWKSWVLLSFHDLFPDNDENGDPDAALGALSSAPLSAMAARVRKEMMNLPPICDHFDKVLAVSTTRTSAVSVTLTSGFTVTRAEEKFVVRMQRAPSGRGVVITNYVDVTATPPETLLDLPSEEEQATPAGQELALAALTSVVRASGAFPAAFPPVWIRHCHAHDTERPETDASHGPRCGKAATAARFTDGGVFDNTPLRLARYAARRGLDVSGSRPAWRALPTKKASPVDDVSFVFVDKDNAAYPAVTDAHAEDKRTALGFLTAFLSTAVEQAMSKELYTLAEEDGIAGVVTTSRALPSAGGHLANFFGFFEQSLREFDFYLGMYDGERFLRKHPDARVRAGQRAPGSPRPAALACMEEVLDDEGNAGNQAPHCASVDPSFRILLQVAIDRIYSICSPPASISSVTDSPHCRRSSLGLPRPIVAGVSAAAKSITWRAREGEGDLDYTMRLLEAYGFEFKDLDRGPTHPRTPANHAMALIREDLGRVVERLGARQDAGGQIALSVLGRAALSFVQYTPPKLILFFDVGRAFDVGVSGRLSPFLEVSPRAAFAFQVKGFTGDPRWAVTPLAGFELEPPLPGRALIEPRIGARAGVQIAAAKDCTAATFAATPNVCHAVVVQGTATVALFDRVRAQFGFEWLRPVFASGVPDQWSGIYSGGLQFLW